MSVLLAVTTALLKGELASKHTEMDTLENLLKRHQQESREGANLLDLLCDNLINTPQQREELAQDRLHHILPNMLQVITGTEERITTRLRACVENEESGDEPFNSQMARGGGGGDSRDTGLLESYMAEKAALEDALQEKEEREQLLLKDLARTQTELQNLQRDRALVQQQRDALSLRLADVERALLEQMQHHIEMQRQAEKGHGCLLAHVQMLEVVLDEQENHRQQQEEQHRAETDNLQQHIHTLKKELKDQQDELEEEKEALQWLLLSQEEQCGKRIATLERSLEEERDRLALLEEEADELKVQLGHKESKMKKARARIRELKNTERRRQVGRKDLELQLRRAEEWKETMQTELGRLGDQVWRQQGERDRLVLLEKEVVELRLQLACKEAKEEQLRAQNRTLENMDRRQRACRKDLEVKLRRAEEWKGAAQSELGRLSEQVWKQQEERERLEILVVTRNEEVQRGRVNIAALMDKNKELKKQEGRLQEGIEMLQQELKAVTDHILELNGQKEERERLEVLVAVRDKEVQHGKAKITDLLEENNKLKQHEESLREEMKRLERDLKAVNDHMKNLNGQHEERENQQEEAQKQVLETLSKALAALREKEEQLVHLTVENGTLRVELATVKDWLSSSTERTETLRETGQIDLGLCDLRLQTELQDLQCVLEVQEDELDYKQREVEKLRQHLGHCELIQQHKHHFQEGPHSSAELLLLQPHYSQKLPSPPVEKWDVAASYHSPVEQEPPNRFSDVDSEEDANQELENTKQLDGKFVAYLLGRDMIPALLHNNYAAVPRAALL